MPYLRIFDPLNGSREEVLRKNRTTIGRQDDMDILLEDKTVSRIHAIINRIGEEHAIEDANSRAGTILNGTRISRAPLMHGDTIQIVQFVLEYRTDDDARETTLHVEGDSAIDRVMRRNFRTMPAGMDLRYRSLSCKPEDLFETGDTLQIGGGGILVFTSKPLDSASVLEVEIRWPTGKSRTFLGEVIAVLRNQKVPGMCIKLHAIDKERYHDVLLWCKRGSWMQTLKPLAGKGGGGGKDKGDITGFYR